MIAKPFPYQKEDILRLEDDLQGRSLYCLEMGLGKTLTSLWFIARQRRATLPAVVVCPASVKYNWEHEAITNIGIRPTVLEGQKPRLHATNGRVFGDEKLIIINYDILVFWLDYLIDLDPKTVIIDESQYLIGRATQRTKAVRQLCKRAPNVLALSGTPLVNRPAELWPTLNILWPKEFPSFWAFGHEYCKPRRTPWGWEFKGATNIPKLNAKLKVLGMIRRLKEDVAKDLPKKIRKILPLRLSKHDEYYKATIDFIGWLQKTKPEKVTRAKKALELTKLGYLLRLAAELKMPAVIDWANNVLEEIDGYPNRKLVLFTCHKKTVKTLSSALKHHKHVIIDGSVTGRKRRAAEDQFQNDKHTRLLIGNLKAAGVGINLTAATDVAFSELWWRPADFVQGEDRAHRHGQKSVTWITYLVAQNTIEDDLCQLIQKKWKIIRQVLDGKTVYNDMNIHDELLAKMKGDIIKAKGK